MPLLGGFPIPLNSFRIILLDASAVTITTAYGVLPRRVPLLSGFLKPLEGLRMILC
jgi:hypothetical protein